MTDTYNRAYREIVEEVFRVKYDYKKILYDIIETQDIDTRNVGGTTSLMYACEAGCLELVHLLINRGADVNAVDRTKRSPLTWAILSWRDDVVDLLISKGADVNHIDGCEYSPLMNARLVQSERMITSLLKAGAL
jgi:ankyrin repeat protein